LNSDPTNLKPVFVTKFVLTKGIVVAAARSTSNPEHVIVHGAYPWDSITLKLGEWHTDPARAVKRAEQMRDQKAAQLEAQAAKLRGMTFEIPSVELTGTLGE
jgi:hypothetical protein